MRILFILALLGLLASLWPAWQHYQGRWGDADITGLVVTDPRARTELGKENGWLGVELTGWEQLSTDRPDDVEIQRNRIRSGIHLGAVAADQPMIGELVAAQTDAYVARRKELDPDGTLLQEMLQDWVTERLKFPDDTMKGFYTRVAVGIYLAARGDPRGRACLESVARRGPFWSEIFPYVRKSHPHWQAVEPLVAGYLEKGTLLARVEAGFTLLDYHIQYDVGAELLDKHMDAIRAAFKEVKAALRAGQLDDRTKAAGERAIFGLAMLANIGYEEERKILRTMKLKYYPYHTDFIRMARVWADLDEFSRYSTSSEQFSGFEQDVQYGYYFAAAHRLAAIRRLPAERRLMKEAERELCLRILMEGFEGKDTNVRIMCLSALARADDTVGKDALRRAIAERSVLSVYAGVLAGEKDLVPILLPALRSQLEDIPAIAAVSLLDIDGPLPLQK